MNLRRELEKRISKALVAAGAPADSPALVGPSKRPEFGDYQANGVMAASKKQKRNPGELARLALDILGNLDGLADSVDVAGPGFINIKLSSDFIGKHLSLMQGDEKLGVQKPERKDTVVVDYSGPNLAKEMHVGHLRSTIIGDALGHVLDFVGHDVIRQNHVGDWGTQFGMLIAYMNEIKASHKDLADLEEFYKAAKQKFDEDADFADTAREYVVKLQGGDKEVAKAWEDFRDVSLHHCEAVYDLLGVDLKRGDVRGESFYNDDLPNVVSDLDKSGLLKKSDGAQCVFLDEFKGKDDEPLPLIVQKSDGGYLYATTDLAALRYRVGKLKADRALYVTDSRQALHFRQVFAVAKEAKFVPADVSLEHVPFGTMMGADGKPFKTREGDAVKLMDLLAEAQERAFDLVSEKNPDLPEDRRREIARVVGIGAVKYADLSQNRTSDYIFSWDKMLSFEGNTAPYMQYAFARISSIFSKNRKNETKKTAADNILIEHPAERGLAIKLLQLPEMIQGVCDECLPNLLCGYLFELAGAFMSFYENCPVLKADEPQRSSRLALCELTASVIKKGLQLLGIETLEQM